jgi:hypothetical protein
MCCADPVGRAQVRVDAVAALRNLVEAFDDDHLDSIKPLLPELLNLLFALMVEVVSVALLQPPAVSPCVCSEAPLVHRLFAGRTACVKLHRVE